MARVINVDRSAGRAGSLRVAAVAQGRYDAAQTASPQAQCSESLTSRLPLYGGALSWREPASYNSRFRWTEAWSRNNNGTSSTKNRPKMVHSSLNPCCIKSFCLDLVL